MKMNGIRDSEWLEKIYIVVMELNCGTAAEPGTEGETERTWMAGERNKRTNKLEYMIWLQHKMKTMKARENNNPRTQYSRSYSSSLQSHISDWVVSIGNECWYMEGWMDGSQAVQGLWWLLMSNRAYSRMNAVLEQDKTAEKQYTTFIKNNNKIWSECHVSNHSSFVW